MWVLFQIFVQQQFQYQNKVPILKSLNDLDDPELLFTVLYFYPRKPRYNSPHVQALLCNTESNIIVV